MTATASKPPTAAPLRQTREEQAVAELGHTQFAPGTRWVLVLAFLLTILAVPVVQHVHDLRAHRAGRRASAWPQAYDILGGARRSVWVFQGTPGSPLNRFARANARMVVEIEQYEQTLERESVFVPMIRDPVKVFLACYLNTGTGGSVIGREGWLFSDRDVAYVTSGGFLEPREVAHRVAAARNWTPHPDSVKAIAQFHEQLRARGIELIVMPVMTKPQVHPEALAGTGRYPATEQVLQNPSYAAWRQQLRQRGIRLYEIGDVLLDVKRSGILPYLRTDTHWTSEAMMAVAGDLARQLREQRLLSDRPAAGYQPGPSWQVTATGELGAILKLPGQRRGIEADVVRIFPVLTAQGTPWQSDPAADVLVLGDSFCEIYSVGAPWWGEASGFGEHLSLALQRPVDLIPLAGGGPHQLRERLAEQRRQGQDRLAGKKLVIWEFTLRELTEGDWRLVHLP